MDFFNCCDLKGFLDFYNCLISQHHLSAQDTRLSFQHSLSIANGLLSFSVTTKSSYNDNYKTYKIFTIKAAVSKRPVLTPSSENPNHLSKISHFTRLPETRHIMVISVTENSEAKMASHCGFHFISSNMRENQCFFHMLFGHLHLFFCKMSVKALHSYFHGDSHLFILISKS